jgi:site-specific DNA recombinase
MATMNESRLAPRNGHTLVVGVVARISGCANQKEVSLEDQFDHAKQLLSEMYDGEIAYKVISTRGKGEQLDRPELAQIEEMLRTGEVDVLFAEDIGRIARGTVAYDLCGIAYDYETRVIAPHDNIDTANENWEEAFISACRDHVGHNAHTSRRIKQKLMNRFTKLGGSTPCEIFGYVRPPVAGTFADWRKDESASEVFAEWLRILRDTLNCSAVADWLNDHSVPVGRHCRRSTWSGAMVRRITGNTILNGMPARGRMHTVKRYASGRRVAVRNPRGPIYSQQPHLAFWSPADFDEINARLADANKGSGRKPVDGADPRLRMPRKRTRFPGQHAACWYCGRQCVWGGNGMKGNLMCSGSRAWRCWNSVGFPGAAVADAIADAVEAELAGIDGSDDQLRELYDQAVLEGGSGLQRELADLARDEEAARREGANLTRSFRAYGPNPLVDGAIKDWNEGQRGLARRRATLEGRIRNAPRLPASGAELREIIVRKFRDLSRDSYEFGDLLRQIAPEVHVYAVRLIDGGHPMPRARVRLDLSGVVPDARHIPGFGDLLSRVLTVDLFDPPLREAIRAKAVRLTAEGLKLRRVAMELGLSQPPVTRALRLDRLMRKRGLDSPYEILTGPPEDYRKLRRYDKPKYRFEPAEGYRPPAL